MTPEDVTVIEVDGERAALLLPTVDETMPAAVREGVARRRLVAIEGICPCGAQFVMPNRAERRKAQRAGRVLQVVVEHETDCPAGTDRILETLAAAGWRP